MAHEISEDEFILSPEEWLKKATEKPLVLTEKGAPKIYLLSKEVFDSLYAGSRRALNIWELTEEEARAFKEAEVPKEYDYLNALMKEDEK